MGLCVLRHALAQIRYCLAHTQFYRCLLYASIYSVPSNAEPRTHIDVYIHNRHVLLLSHDPQPRVTSRPGPTILDDATPDMECYKEEIFGVCIE